MNITSTEYNMLYSCFTIPNIFMACILGYIADKLGKRQGISCTFLDLAS